MVTMLERIDVAVPVAEVYRRWSDPETFAVATESVSEVVAIDGRHTRWRASISGEARTWTVETVDAVPGHRLAWRSRDGLALDGVVSFHPVDEGHTQVVVSLDWEPRGTFERLGHRLGLVGRRVAADPDRLRQHLEHATAAGASGPGADQTGHAPSGGAPDDRGRLAQKPGEIPASGWKDVLARTMQQVKEDNVSILSAGVAFFAFLALVPALVAVLSVYGLVANPSEVTAKSTTSPPACPRT